ncbi:MAG: ABC transporter permease subunit [Clostridium sp.]
MLLPYLVSSCCDTMLKERKKYLEDSAALGVSDWYAAATMILPAAMPNMLMSMVLAVGRAMGETMAVMMVMGNANLFPKLLGKSESIASVIALEMGTAVSRKSSLPCAVRGRYGAGGTLDDDQSGNSYGAKISDGRKCSMRWIGTLTRFWAWLSTALVGLIILFLFGYVFEHGAGNISLEF